MDGTKIFRLNINLSLLNEAAALALLDFTKRGAMGKACGGSVTLSSEEVDARGNRTVITIEIWEVSADGRKTRVK